MSDNTESRCVGGYLAAFAIGALIGAGAGKEAMHEERAKHLKAA